MISEDTKIRLWTHITDQFNVAVLSVGEGLTAGGHDCAVVMIDENTDPATIKMLPASFENGPVEYETGRLPSAGPAAIPCGQPGHQCSCGPK